MATADLDFNLKISGTPEELASLAAIMLEYDVGKNNVYFSCGKVIVGNKEFSTRSENDEIITAARSAESVIYTALGPFGKYGELDEIDIFREMAEAAPNASFTASVSGFAGYADQSLDAKLSDGLLKVSTYYMADDWRGDGERDYFKSILPYDKFIELFKLDGEEFDEDMYEDFLFDAIGDFDSIGEFFEETEYEEFIDLLDAQCSLTEEEYDEVREEFTGLADESVSDYLDREDYAKREEYTYDPVKKEYLGGKTPTMKTGVAYSINDNIREYLDSIGHPSDDETIAALSVEDVYAILAGTYGKDDSEDADKCGSDDEDTEDADGEDDPDECSDDDTDEGGFTESEACDDNTASESAAATPTEAEPEKTEAEIAETETGNDISKKKKSFPVWLIIAIILVAVAACVLGFGEEIWDYIADFIGNAACVL